MGSEMCIRDRAWTDGSDEANALLIAPTRARADLVVTLR